MLEALKKQFAVQWKDWMTITLVILGGWLLGIGLHFMITRLDSEAVSYFPMGTLMGALAAGVSAVLMGIIELGFYFNVEVSMGCTRVRFFCSYYVVFFVFSVLYTGIVILLNLAERVLEKQLYPGWECEIDFFPYLLKGGIPAAAAFCLVSGFCGALLLRYGKKAFWVLWVIWMVCAVGIPQIHEATEKAPNSLFGRIGTHIGGLFGRFTVNEVISIVAALSILSLVGAWLYLRKQQVTS